MSAISTSASSGLIQYLPKSVRDIMDAARDPNNVVVAALDLLVPASIVGGAAGGAIAAGLCTAINPIAGAIFGASLLGACGSFSILTEKYKCFPDSLIGRIANAVLPTLVGLAGIAGLIIAGVALTEMSWFILSVGTLVAAIATPLALIGAALAYRMCNNHQVSAQSGVRV